jgi:tetratricopeptide (TPR) repeat protein
MAGAIFIAAFLTSQRVAATAPPFWERVAASSRTAADLLLTEAEGLLAAREPATGDKGGAQEPARRDAALAPRTNATRAEALVRRALVLVPEDFRALAALAEIDGRAGRQDAALADLERACPHAGGAAGACWFRLGVERSRLGRIADAVAAYEAGLATGAADVTSSAAALVGVYANLGELLMALGRLDEAEGRYREALRLGAPAADRLDDRHELTLATYGFAVVLDREGNGPAAREMMARALALDPRLATLQAGREPGGDVFFVPEGDVYYYLGLAAEVAGRGDDAEAAYQEFLERLPRSPWSGRARAHIEALERAGGAPATSSAPRLRVLAAGTVSSQGPIPAPLVDAAWRERRGLLDGCLEEAARAGTLPARSGVRLALELDLDPRGLVTGVDVRAAPPFAEVAAGPFARCVEGALRAGLRVPRPQTPRPTRARLELLIGVGP